MQALQNIDPILDIGAQWETFSNFDRMVTLLTCGTKSNILVKVTGVF